MGKAAVANEMIPSAFKLKLVATEVVNASAWLSPITIA